MCFFHVTYFSVVICEHNSSFFAYRSMGSIQAITFPSLYDNLPIMYNLHCIPLKVILNQDAINVSHSHLLQVNTKQVAVMVSHSHLPQVITKQAAIMVSHSRPKIRLSKQVLMEYYDFKEFTRVLWRFMTKFASLTLVFQCVTFKQGRYK